MTLLRSALFQVAFYGWTAVMILAFLPALLSRRVLFAGMALWARGAVALLAWTAAIRVEVRGREHLPAGPAVVASKHQSAFDTFIFLALLDRPAIVMKQELLRIPLYGLISRKSGMIAIDRDGGSAAALQMVKAARERAAEGRSIVIFPEGTRTAPGQHLPYQPGAAALYRMLGLPAVPVALNSGVFWPRRRFVKRPGTIVIEFLPPLPPGLPRRAFERRLESAVEEASLALLPATARPVENPAATPGESPGKSP